MQVFLALELVVFSIFSAHSGCRFTNFAKRSEERVVHNACA